jgi:hypothetical protein
VGEVEAVPEELRRALLAAEARREPAEHLGGAAQHGPEALDRGGVVAVVDGVLRERRAVAEVERPREDLHVDADVGQRGEQVGVEARARQAVAQGDARGAPVARADVDAVVDEVQLDLGPAVTGRHRAGGEAVRRGMEGHVPPVVERGHERHAHLADDLGEAVQRLLRLAPVLVGQGRPGVAHRASAPAGASVVPSQAIAAGTWSGSMWWPASDSW